MRNKTIHHKEIQNYIFHGYGWYGGNKYKQWLKKTYGLREFKKGKLVYLQKIPTKKKLDQQNSSNNE
ncbi:MAG: hypothetical protein QXO70_04910 [Candidatus Pacearchaeota archaeon]